MAEFTNVRYKGIILAFLSTLLGAATTIVYKPLMQSGVSFNTIGFIESLTIVLLLSWYRPAWDLKGIKTMQKRLLLGGAFLQGLGAFSFYIALNYLDPVTFSFLGRNQATCSLLLSFFFLRERHNPILWLFIATCFIGSFSLAWTELNHDHPIGLWFIALFCLSFSLRSFILRKYPHTPTLPGIFYGYSFSLIFILVSKTILDGSLIFDMPPIYHILQITITAALAVLGSVLFYIQALSCEPLALVSCIRLFSPYFVMVYFVCFRGYEMASNKLYGFILMSVALLLFVVGKYRKQLFTKLKILGS